MDEIQYLFKHWGFHAGYYADKIGMKRSTFYSKMDPKQSPQFTDQEVAKIRLCLVELKKQLPDG